MSWHTGRKSVPAGTTTSKVTPWVNWPPKSARATSPPNLASRRAKGLGNHAAYLRNWLEALKNDRNYIFKAAKQASKVTDYLLSFVKTPEPEAVGALQ